MRPKGTSEQLAQVRNRGLSLLEAGKKPKEVAEILNVTPRCVNRWRQKTKTPKRKKATRPPGRPRKLSEKQIKRLEKALDQGAYTFGLHFRVCWRLLDTRQDCASHLAIVRGTVPSECGLACVGSDGLE